MWVRSILALVTLIMVVGACAPSDTLPTQMVIPNVAPADTEIADEETVVMGTATERPTLRSRPTLPPTWTPTPAEIQSATPITLEPVFTPFAQQNNLPAACDTFRIDPENSDSNFPIGSSPRAAWTAVEGADLYRVTIGDDLGRNIRDDIYIAENSYVFDANLFELGRFYAWTVYPIDGGGDQMCFQSGFDLIPIRPLGS